RHAAHLAATAAPHAHTLAPEGPAPAPAPAPALASAPTPALAPSLEELLPALVRRIAWSGDSRRGAVRLEVGSGELAGATLLIQADGGRLEVTLTAPGADAEAWRERIARRLADKGLDVDAV